MIGIHALNTCFLNFNIQSQCVQFSMHCRERMPARGVTVDDFLNVLLWVKLLMFKKIQNAKTLNAK